MTAQTDRWDEAAVKLDNELSACCGCNPEWPEHAPQCPSLGPRPDSLQVLAAALRAAYQQGQEDEREACARICDRRVGDQRGEAAALIEHYGPDANDEASMYDADAIGSAACAKAIRARVQEEPKR